MKPLTKSQQNKILSLLSLKAEVEGFVMDRVDYIIEKIADTFDSEVKWWSFPCSSEYHSMGNFYDAYNDDCFQFEGEFKRSHSWTIILDDGEEYDLNNEFPTRWLYENFEEELINGKKELEQKIAKQKEDKVKKTLLKNSTKKKLLESAKSKLTEEEKKALGL